MYSLLRERELEVREGGGVADRIQQVSHTVTYNMSHTTCHMSYGDN